MTRRKSNIPEESRRIRCPRLGHQIGFQYCRIENQGLPCIKVLDCWNSYFQVEDFLREELTEEEWKRTFSGPPTSKMLSLLELIDRAKERTKKAE